MFIKLQLFKAENLGLVIADEIKVKGLTLAIPDNLSSFMQLMFIQQHVEKLFAEFIDLNSTTVNYSLADRRIDFKDSNTGGKLSVIVQKLVLDDKISPTHAIYNIMDLVKTLKFKKFRTAGDENCRSYTEIMNCSVKIFENSKPIKFRMENYTYQNTVVVAAKETDKDDHVLSKVISELLDCKPFLDVLSSVFLDILQRGDQPNKASPTSILPETIGVTYEFAEGKEIPL